MLGFQGISAASLADMADKRKANSSPGQNTVNNDRPPPVSTNPFGHSLKDSSVFQFQTARAATPLTDQAAKGPLFTPPEPEAPPAKKTAFLQTLPAFFERIIAQVGSFFLGARRQTPGTQESTNRKLNDYFTLDFLGESKVEPVQHSLMGDGSN